MSRSQGLLEIVAETFALLLVELASPDQILDGGPEENNPHVLLSRSSLFASSHGTNSSLPALSQCLEGIHWLIVATSYLNSP